MTNSRGVALVAAALLCSALGVFQLAAIAQQGKDIEQAKQSLLDFDRAFNTLIFEQGIAAAFDSCMADDATIYRNGFSPLTGRTMIHDFLWQTPSEGKGTMKCETKFTDVAASMDLGYTLGTYEFATTDSVGQEIICGNYVAIYKKQADGQWKAVFDSDISYPMPSE